jgi:N-acetylglucosaminyl-diphospho-decaprenol L-rhamnosyltransferase
MHECRLSIIIVNWNTEELLRQCLASFHEEALRLGFEIIVVDNASSDGSAEMLRNEFPRVQILQNTRNMGFARANNQAIRVARSTYFLLLNSDTIITRSGVFEEWLDFMDCHPNAGASGCRLVFPDGSHQVGDAGFRPSLTSTLNYAFFLSRISPSRFRGLFLSYDKLLAPLEVDWVCGAAFLVRRSVTGYVGLLDETQFMYAEDVEWGCRIRSCGYAVYYLPHIEIVHLQGASARKQKDRREFSLLWLANLRRLYTFYNGPRGLFLYDIMLSFGFLLRSAFYYLSYLRLAGENLKAKSLQMAKCMEFCLRQWYVRD